MLDKTQRRYYEDLLKRTRQEYIELEHQVSRELASVKERIAELRSQMDATLKIYEGICERLGVENDLAPPDEEDES